MKKGKIFIKAALFLGIFLLIGTRLTGILIPKWISTTTQMKSFYELERNSIEVLGIGSSSMLMGFSPLTLWEEEGISSQSICSNVQSPQVAYAVLEEALKTQTPKVLLLGPMFLFEEYDMEENEVWVRSVADNMKWSKTKMDLVQEAIQGDENQSFSSYLFPLLRYHSRWEELGQEDYVPHHWLYDHMRGQLGAYNIAEVPSLSGRIQQDAEPLAYNEESKEYYDKILQLCRDKGIAVILITFPREDWDSQRHAGMAQYAKEQGVTYLDYNTDELLDGTGLDCSADFDDENHLNANGAIKVSRHLAAYLKEEYPLSDRRGDADYAWQWNVDLERFHQELETNWAFRAQELLEQEKSSSD